MSTYSSNVMYLLGTAGSGKSLLTKKLSESLYDAGWTVIRVNLDPGVRQLPYVPDVDVRNYIDIDQIIEQYELGPNGALIACADLLITKIDDLKEEIESFGDVDYIIIDTVGQIEIFAYRKSGKLFVTALSDKKNVAIHLVDVLLAKTPAGFVSMALLSASLKVRFPMPQLAVLSKSDLISEEELERIYTWSNPEYLADALEITTKGQQRELSVTLFNTLKMQGYIGELIPVSSITTDGTDVLISAIEHIFDSYLWEPY